MASRPPTEPCIPVWYTAPPLFIPLQTCGSKNRKTGIQPSQAVGLRGLCSILGSVSGFRAAATACSFGRRNSRNPSKAPAARRNPGAAFQAPRLSPCAEDRGWRACRDRRAICCSSARVSADSPPRTAGARRRSGRTACGRRGSCR